jgi:DNA-binding winged helix-turn-helix (wHTH) protein
MSVLRHDIDFGGLVLRADQRSIGGPLGTAQLEPLVARLLLTLAQRAGRIVARETLFEECWPGAAMGDDSLNRLVAVARRALRETGGNRAEIVTIPASGYILRLRPLKSGEDHRAERDAAVRAAFLSWRNAYPVPNFAIIERLRAISDVAADDATCLGMLALMYRHAAEYGPVAERGELVRSCEMAAAAALAIDATQPEARVALAGIVPIFGHWKGAYTALSAVLDDHPGHIIATHDLAIVEMATGRPRQAKRLIDPLFASDPRAPCFGYKSTFQHWSLGDLATMNHRAEQAIQLWPDHPAVWTARFWTLAYTGRPSAALAMIEPGMHRPVMREPVAAFARRLLRWAIDGSGDRTELVREAVEAVATGPVQAINSLMALGLLGDVDAGFEVAEAYYLQEGPLAVPSQTDRESPLNEQHRRVTQQLVVPASAGMRADPRIIGLCEKIGLARYWAETGRLPEIAVFGFN